MSFDRNRFLFYLNIRKLLLMANTEFSNKIYEEVCLRSGATSKL
jgi:hypothetical protein